MVTNLAVVSSDTPQTVRFADQEGFVFDRITFEKGVVVEGALMRNGFRVVLDNDPYVQLFGLPSTITDTGKDSKPIYPLGEYWRF